MSSRRRETIPSQGTSCVGNWANINLGRWIKFRCFLKVHIAVRRYSIAMQVLYINMEEPCTLPHISYKRISELLWVALKNKFVSPVRVPATLPYVIGDNAMQ